MTQLPVEQTELSYIDSAAPLCYAAGSTRPFQNMEPTTMTNEEQAIKIILSTPRQPVRRNSILLRDRLKKKWAALKEDPDACFEYGNKESPNYGRYTYHLSTGDGNKKTVNVSIPRLAALLFNMPLPKGRAGCGNKWCLNPAHFTPNPNKWQIREASRETDLGKRLLHTKEELRAKLDEIGVGNNYDLAKNRRVGVRAIMSDGTRGKTRMSAAKVLAYLNASDEGD